MYIQQITTEWKEEDIKRVKNSRNKNIETHLFMDDQVTMADLEDALQISVHKLEMVTSKYGPKI
jgi:predicted lipoprotein